MSKPLPWLFFAVIKDGPRADVRRLHLSQRLQARLTQEFDAQRAGFFEGSQAIPFDPRYKPDDGDEHFLVRGYVLPPYLQRVAAGADAIPAVEPDDFDAGRVRSVFGVSQSPPAREMSFQSFDGANVLRRGVGLLARRDRFDELEETAVVLKNRLSAHFDGADLAFRSVHLVSRYLDLTRVFEEATTEELRTFLTSPRFAAADLQGLLTLSDSWVRRKVASINARRALTGVSTADIRRVAAEFNVALATTVSPEGDERIVLPTQKRALKELLRLLDQDLLECSLTSEKFRVNSKASVDRASRDQPSVSA